VSHLNNPSTKEPGYKLLETLAALTSEIYVDHKLLNNFDTRLGDEPFVGKLAILIDTSEKFEREAIARKVDWDHTHDWILCIEALAIEISTSNEIYWDDVFTAGNQTVIIRSRRQGV
jgi:hypothetical protein